MLILGGGVTGLAASIATGATVLEAASGPGGLCGSYHVEGFRFERGGGHWIFGGDAEVLALLDACSPLTRHTRRAAAHFIDRDVIVPFPVQHHADALGSDIARRVAGDPRSDPRAARTMKEWLAAGFGETLCEEFFFPFHDTYTAGLYDEIAPQDGYKTPGVGARSAGYNPTFVYPAAGLDRLTRALADRGAPIEYGARVTAIDTDRRVVACADGRAFSYDTLISTLPLHETVRLAEITVAAPPDPYTSVLVLNIGARRGPKSPDAHWVYVPKSESGFHRVGIYSNVDESFLPGAARGRGEHVALYVERAYRGGERDAPAVEAAYIAIAIEELQMLGYIDDVDVVDASWIEVAYTWTRPESTWVVDACAALQANGVQPVGRYARWHFQGIAESVREGLDCRPA